ncbi:MAG: circadian clock protein KaiB [Ignavibacteriaceae bacterium]|nr:circadian clock protein KaiB [Ignavibacteriaceae bacterium]
MKKYLLKLFITGKTSRSEAAISNLKQICSENLNEEYDLLVIDVLDNPQLADDEKVLATPTLIKELPPPLRRIIGDLSEKEKVIKGLELKKINEQE